MFQPTILREYHALLKVVLRFVDLFVMFFTAYLAHYYKFHHYDLSHYYANTLWIAMVATFVCFAHFKLYEPIRGRRLFNYLANLTVALLFTLAIIAAASFLIKSAVILSREWFLVWGLLAWVALVFLRCVAWSVAYICRRHGWNPRRVVIVGTNELALNLVKEMQKALGNGFKVVAFIGDADQAGAKLAHVPVRGMPQDVNKWLRRTQTHEVWIALPLKEEEAIQSVLYELRHNLLTVRYVFDFFGLSLHQHALTEISGFPVVDCFATPLSGANHFVKAIEDKVLALLILTLISPVMLCIAIGVKLSSPGPIFFRQIRHGWNGKKITVYKFRSMYLHEEQKGRIQQAVKNDHRVTKFGRILRKYSLDELPQFINVLQGRMSIVGPRPHVVSQNEHYKELVTSYMQRHRVKPGITGWAQANGYRGETDTLEKMRKRVEHDIYYIENWSLWFDIKIILLTIYRSFKDTNAY